MEITASAFISLSPLAAIWWNEHGVLARKSKLSIAAALQPSIDISDLRWTSKSSLESPAYASPGLAVPQNDRSMAGCALICQTGDLSSPRVETMAMAHMPLPTLTCSFPSMLHPLYENVRVHWDQWIETVVRPATPVASRGLRQCLLPRLACRFMPAASSRWRLLQAVKLLAWLILDVADNQRTWLSAEGWTDRILTVLTEPVNSYDDRRLWNYDLLDDRLPRQSFRRLAALGDLWGQIGPDMSPHLRSRFIRSMADYLQGTQLQAALRKEDCIADIDSFMEFRRQGSFTTAGFILLEYAYGAELDQAAAVNPHLIELRQKAADYITLCQDVVLFSKKIRLQRDSSIRLPAIFYAASYTHDMRQCINGACLQKAVDSVARLSRDTEARCAALMGYLKEDYSEGSADPVQASNVCAYVDALALAMSGTLSWLLELPSDAHI